MMVWVGDEPKMELPTVFKKGDFADGNGNFIKDNLLYIIISVLIIIIAILFFKFKKKNEKSL